MKMAAIAKECLTRPTKPSVWVPELGRYVCPETWEGAAALQRFSAVSRRDESHPLLAPQFKLVFLTAFTGTLLFAGICVTMTFLAGKEPHPLFEKVIMGFFDLAKIGFGAVVGLLGGKSLQGSTKGTQHS
jgi:hypothetical protein